MLLHHIPQTGKLQGMCLRWMMTDHDVVVVAIHSRYSFKMLLKSRVVYAADVGSL